LFVIPAQTKTLRSKSNGKRQKAAIGRFHESGLTASWPLRAAKGAEQVLRAGMFCENPDWFRGLRRTLPSSTGSVWRFHDPPNLEWQYQRRRKSCQEKNAKSGWFFSRVSISSGGVPKARSGFAAAAITNSR
jgi:hypothetical protein